MTKTEFEALTLRNGAKITSMLYGIVEHFYMSDNDYHKAHGGADEDKRAFCIRVFGGKVNTPASIARKITAESQAENRYALAGCDVSEESLAHMDSLIAEDIATAAAWRW